MQSFKYISIYKKYWYDIVEKCNIFVKNVQKQVWQLFKKYRRKYNIDQGSLLTNMILEYLEKRGEI